MGNECGCKGVDLGEVAEVEAQRTVSMVNDLSPKSLRALFSFQE